MLMRHHRDLTRVCINQQLGSLYVVSLKVADLIDDMKWGLTVYSTICLSLNLLRGIRIMYFPCFAIVNIAAINTFVQVSVSVLFFFLIFFSSFGCLLRRWISGSCGNSTFSFWRNYQIVFRGGCTVLYSYQQTLIILFHSNFSTKEMITFLSVLDAFLGYLSCFQTIF